MVGKKQLLVGQPRFGLAFLWNFFNKDASELGMGLAYQLGNPPAARLLLLQSVSLRA